MVTLPMILSKLSDSSHPSIHTIS